MPGGGQVQHVAAQDERSKSLRKLRADGKGAR
jgi:hypothetical protein